MAAELVPAKMAKNINALGLQSVQDTARKPPEECIEYDDACCNKEGTLCNQDQRWCIEQLAPATKPDDVYIKKKIKINKAEMTATEWD